MNQRRKILVWENVRLDVSGHVSAVTCKVKRLVLSEARHGRDAPTVWRPFKPLNPDDSQRFSGRLLFVVSFSARNVSKAKQLTGRDGNVTTSIRRAAPDAC